MFEIRLTFETFEDAAEALMRVTGAPFIQPEHIRFIPETDAAAEQECSPVNAGSPAGESSWR